MLAIVGSEGQPSPPFFVAPGERLTAVVFQALLRRPGPPWVKRASPDDQNNFYQDGGLCHVALNTRQLLVASTVGQSTGRSALAAAVTLPPPAEVQHQQRFLGPGPGKLHAKFGGPKGLHSAVVAGTN